VDTAGLQFRLDIINLAFSCYLQIQFFNQQLFGQTFFNLHLHKEGLDVEAIGCFSLSTLVSADE
jgi:hypothetical protein